MELVYPTKIEKKNRGCGSNKTHPENKVNKVYNHQYGELT